MKEKIFNFIREKKDLLIFVGILSVVFISVIFIANYALSSDVPVNTDEPTINPDPNPSPDEDNTPDPVVYKFKQPASETIIVRTFFDDSYSEEELLTALISTGEGMEPSLGVGYAKKDNSTFNVVTMYPGTVNSIETDNKEYGIIVTVKHSENVYTRYKALSKVNVSVGDKLTENSVIGVSGTATIDNEAGIHVLVELIVNSEFIDVSRVIDKTITEVSSLK